MTRVVIIDNYDSFTYNVAQRFQVLGAIVEVFLNDKVTVSQLRDLAPDSLVISPGPGGPSGTGVSRAAFREFRGKIPILGVCLGHQMIAELLGATVEPGTPVHGKPSLIHHDGVGIFAAMPSPFPAARYHSLVVRGGEDRLRRVAWTEDGTLMGFGAPGEATWGVQFHPESFMTPAGDQLLRNFLSGVECAAS
ncbi:MAG: aminodeoxychorismate/anthranilate synthase component II [Planctomycetota bacterium]